MDSKYNDYSIYLYYHPGFHFLSSSYHLQMGLTCRKLFWNWKLHYLVLEDFYVLNILPKREKKNDKNTKKTNMHTNWLVNQVLWHYNLLFVNNNMTKISILTMMTKKIQNININFNNSFVCMEEYKIIATFMLKDST